MQTGELRDKKPGRWYRLAGVGKRSCILSLRENLLKKYCESYDGSLPANDDYHIEKALTNAITSGGTELPRSPVSDGKSAREIFVG